MDIEAPGEDAAEQAREVAEDGHDDRDELLAVPFDVNEADAAEQVRDVGYDDDDYR
jgi:hypothetical protein